jgi:hypothetical protein
MREPIDTLQRFLQQVEDFGRTGPSPNAAASARGPTLLTTLFTGTRNFASGFFTTVLFLLFFSCLAISSCTASSRYSRASAASGRRNLAANRKRHLRVSGHDHDHERGSRPGYGIGDVAHAGGRPDPLGDSGLSAELCADPRNCFGRVDLLLAGLLTLDSLWQALLPAALYLGFHLIEGETVTPMLLARWFTLNPVLVIISLVFWFWMWGIPGAILSVPMLAITKIICDSIRPLAAFGHFLER